jgi:hypothetical protein
MYPPSIPNQTSWLASHTTYVLTAGESADYPRQWGMLLMKSTPPSSIRMIISFSALPMGGIFFLFRYNQVLTSGYATLWGHSMGIFFWRPDMVRHQLLCNTTKKDGIL